MQITEPTTGGHAPDRRVDARPVAVAGAASIALTAIFIRLADVSPATSVFYRCLLAVPFLAALAWREHRRGHRVTCGDIGRYAAAGMMLGVDFALWSQAILLIGAGISTVLVNVQVVVVPLLSLLVLGTRMPPRFLVALPVLFAGIALTAGIADGVSTGPGLVWGTILALASGVAYAGYIFVVGGRGSADTAATQVLVSTTAAGAAGSALGSVWGAVDLTPGWVAFGWLAALAVSAQFIGWVLLGRSLPRLPPDVGATLLLLQPVLAVAAATVVLGERPTALQLVGCAIVVAAAWCVAARPETIDFSRVSTTGGYCARLSADGAATARARCGQPSSLSTTCRAPFRVAALPRRLQSCSHSWGRRRSPTDR